MDSFEDPSNLIVGEELLMDARLMAEEKKPTSLCGLGDSKRTILKMFTRISPGFLAFVKR